MMQLPYKYSIANYSHWIWPVPAGSAGGTAAGGQPTANDSTADKSAAKEGPAEEGAGQTDPEV